MIGFPLRPVPWEHQCSAELVTEAPSHFAVPLSLESAVLHFEIQKESSDANTEIKEILNFFMDKAAVFQPHSTGQKHGQAVDKAEDYLELSKQRLDPHCIFSAMFHLNKTKSKRNKLPISKMFHPRQ